MDENVERKKNFNIDKVEGQFTPGFYGKNREKLLKLEIQMHMKDYLKQKEINSRERERVIDKSRAYTSTYSKYNKPEELNRNNIITNNLLTNNILSNMFTKQKIFSWLGIPTKYDEMNYYSKWWRFYDICITFCNFLVLLLAIYDYELNFSYPRKIKNEYNTVRVLMILLSLVALFCVLKRHYNKHKWRNVSLSDSKSIKKYKYGKEKNFEPDDDDDFFYTEHSSTITGKKRKFFRKGLFLDILINLIIPYPLLDFIKKIVEVDRENNEYIMVEYLFSDFLYILVISRMIYLIRATINYSIFSDHYANTVAKEHGVKCNVRFALKCILKTHHIKIVFIFFLASNIFLGFALRVFERPFWAAKGRLEFEYLTNSLWLVFITMLTIGYGDYVPMTTAGRIILVISGLWGTFIISLVVVCLYGLLDLSNDQFMVFVKIVKSRVAIKFIEDAYSLRKARLNKRKNPEAVTEEYSNLLESFLEFKNMRNESKSIYRSNGLLYYNMKLLKEMKKFNQRFAKLEMDIESLTIGNSNIINISNSLIPTNEDHTKSA